MPSSSIVIPVYNRASLTRQCLQALLGGQYRFGRPEIIVVDDASTDITPRLLAEYAGAVTAIRQPANRGYAESCNTGAAAASGDYVILLNNDTLPQPGWLDALIQYAEAHPAAAEVGSKLLYLNDSIQHAGVVIGQDGYPRHLYAGFPANHPAVNKSRRFQVVTAACVLIRRAAFFEARGFDTVYLNGLEDVDLCLRLGELGYEIHYCHNCVVYHFESATRLRTGEHLMRGLERYEQRWLGRVQPDDMRYYVEDGLLQITYPAFYPLLWQVSPDLATSPTSEPDQALARLLHARTAQVEQLLREVADRSGDHPVLAVTPIPGAPIPPGQPAGAAAASTERPKDPYGQADLMHPDVQRLVGSGDPWAIGQHYLDYCIEAGGLEPDDHVLEVGCGTGRIALALARYLSPAGAYDGFDIRADFVDWCREKITPRYPNFRFQHADVINTAYNPGGHIPSASFRFPYADETFDLVYLVSVFTHMLPDGLENYVAEIVRVLRPGGRCLISLFLLDDENTWLVEAGRASLAFPNRHGTYRTEADEIPEGAVAYDLDYVRDLFRRHGLSLREPVQFGDWSGRQHDVIPSQDYVVVTKPGGLAAVASPWEPHPAELPERAAVVAATSAALASARVLWEGASHTLPGGPGQTRLSLLMPIKNGEATLARVLGQVLRQQFPAELEIIAVDSGSTDDSLAILKSFQATVVAIEPATFDNGLVRNLLASYAHGQYLVYLNKQALPANDQWLANLVQPLQANPCLAGVCSRLIPWPNADPLVYRDVLAEPNGSPDRAILSLASPEEYERLSPDERRLRLIFSTASAAIRPEVLARFPFRPVRLVNEDIQWAKDVLTAGYHLQYEPASLIYHSHNYSLAELFQRNVDDAAANAGSLGRHFPSEAIGPTVLAQIQADQIYLRESLGLTGPALDDWQLEASLRRTVQIMGQWVGSNTEALDPALLGALSLIERTRRGSAPADRPAAAEPARPLPPPDMQYRATCAADSKAFDRGGREAVDDFASALAAHGAQLADFKSILDFGCGPGRVLRHLAGRVPGARLSGCDVDPQAVHWLRTHYPLVDARRNGTLPPLPFEAGTFDLVLGYSVFTHLNQPHQDAWLTELRRVTTPGAWLLLTVHGNWHWQRTPLRTAHPEMDEALQQNGFLHWRGDGWAGHFPDYYHTSWHTPDYIRQHWSRWFTVVAVLEGHARPTQDTVVLRRT